MLWHAFDLANLALLWPLVPWIAWRRRRELPWLGLGTLLLVLVYLPFYYPGSYPGGGARLIADALPLEHILLALALTELKVGALFPALSVLGFALSTVHSHLALRDRDGGRPMFEEQVLDTRGVTRGLVFVDTDHGFALGHDPAARDPHRALVVARGYGDAHDLALWSSMGRPPAFRYRYPAKTGRASLEPYVPSASPWRWELDAEWPPLEVVGGWAHPDFRPCLTAGRGLHLRDAVKVRLGLGAPEPGRYRMSLGWMADPGTEVQLTIAGSARRATHRGAGCEVADLGEIELAASATVFVSTDRSLLLDYLELTRVTSK